MTVPNEDNSIVYVIESTGDIEYPYPYKMTDDSSIDVCIIPNDITLQPVFLEHVVNYTYEINNNNDGCMVFLKPSSITFPQFVNGAMVKIFRIIPYTQTYSYLDSSPLNYEKYEQSLDKLVLLSKDILLGRKMFFAFSNVVYDRNTTLIKGKLANHYLIWGAPGSGISSVYFYTIDYDFNEFWLEMIRTSYTQESLLKSLDLPCKATQAVISGAWSFGGDEYHIFNRMSGNTIKGTSIEHANTIFSNLIESTLCKSIFTKSEKIDGMKSSFSFVSCSNYTTDKFTGNVAQFDGVLGSLASLTTIRLNDLGGIFPVPPDFPMKYRVFNGTGDFPSLACVYDPKSSRAHKGINISLDGTLTFFNYSDISKTQYPNLVLFPNGQYLCPNMPYTLLTSMFRRGYSIEGKIDNVVMDSCVHDEERNAVEVKNAFKETAGDNIGLDKLKVFGGAIARTDGIYHISIRVAFDASPQWWLGWPANHIFYLVLSRGNLSDPARTQYENVGVSFFRTPTEGGFTHKLTFDICKTLQLRRRDVLSLRFYSVDLFKILTYDNCVMLEQTLQDGMRSWFIFSKIG